MNKKPSPIETFDYIVHGHDGPIPVAQWRPAHIAKPTPVVLVGHGGSQHKRAQPVQDIAELFAGHHQLTVVAIDGPIHGARRDVIVAGPSRQQEFLALWQQDTRIVRMQSDWTNVIHDLSAQPGIDVETLVWYGVSMGTAYGIPVLAANPRIRAAVLGMWGLDFPNSQELLALAPEVRCPLLFQQKWNDQIFGREGQLALFDALGASRKWLKIYMGEHGPPTPEQIEDLERFLMVMVGDSRA